MNESKHKLTDEQYYNWALSIEQLEHAETKSKLLVAQISLQKAKVSIEELKAQVISARVPDAAREVERSKREYEDTKLGLESELGFSLNGKIVNESLEIIDEEDL